MLWGELAVLVAEIFAELLVTLGGINQLDFAFPWFGLVVAENPYVGGDPCIVEEVVGELDDGVEEIVLDDVASSIALSSACIAGVEAGAVVNRGNALALWTLRERLDLSDHFH